MAQHREKRKTARSEKTRWKTEFKTGDDDPNGVENWNLGLTRLDIRR